MKIAYFCAHYLMHRGGAELHVHRLAEELARRGHELTIYAAEGPLAAFPDAPYRVVALPCDAAKERRMKRWLSLENRRGGYRLAQWLFRSGRHRLLASGKPTIASKAGRRGYEKLSDSLPETELEDFPARVADLLTALSGDRVELDDSARLARNRLRDAYDWSAIARPYLDCLATLKKDGPA